MTTHPTPTIPKGWRRLRVGTIRRKGDKFYLGGRLWLPVNPLRWGEPITPHDTQHLGPYIRRIQPRKKAGK